MPVIEETITTEPPPEARRCGRPDRISSAAWPAFRAKVAVNSSSAALVRLPLPTVPPALATRWSRPPAPGAQARSAPGHQPDRRAFGRERLGDRQADAPAAPGDQRAATLQAKFH